ncbi:hydratase [Ruminococcaceae bacterium OttesenSCG-928-A11]|nr:hydratase [Ruminococcaceae bacterium OttesenSCG-928-A11]
MKIYEKGVYLVNGKHIVPDDGDAPAALAQLAGQPPSRAAARNATMAWGILEKHNRSDDAENLKITFDVLCSHDITYVGIIQTARASGMERFPVPYVLTNCHNSLCAVGGTINEDDHMFAISAAQKYGGIYVPTHLAVIHQYMREAFAGGGKMILGSDSHTRYGHLGTMAIGEGGGELAKQLMGRSYDVKRPEVVAVYLKNAPKPGVGPQDVALAIIGQVFASGFVKNKVMEFVGPGIDALPVEYRGGIDVMTTETTCLSSIWRTDDAVRDYLAAHGRAGDYRQLEPGPVALYDGMLEIDLAAVKPMIALPFHPSNVYPIEAVQQNAGDILRRVEQDAERQFGSGVSLNLTGKIQPGGIQVDQGIVAGCAGGSFSNVCAASDILAGRTPGNGRFSMSVYPASQPTYVSLIKNGRIEALMNAGVLVRSAFCGPCFGAGDVPANGALSVRHTTRNFPNREGSKPADGQLSAVALMDARSIAATAANGGVLTAATQLDAELHTYDYKFEDEAYKNRVYNGFGNAKPETALQFGPNIADWPEMPALTDNLLLKVAAFITDPVTTTDELIPSGETSSYRSNPLKLAEFTLSRKDPQYVPRAKAVHQAEKQREAGENPFAEGELAGVWAQVQHLLGEAPNAASTGIGSVLYAVKPGDGSAREQAASCQKVLGGWANIAREYATKRYRSNLINWGVLPFVLDEAPAFGNGDYIFVPGIRNAVQIGERQVRAFVLGSEVREFTLGLGELTDDERRIIIDGCLINFYRNEK